MSKIKEILNDTESVIVFDVDGVLALFEWGEYNHYTLTDEEWLEACEKGINNYTEERVSKKMQNFFKGKDMTRMYVITRARSSQEGEFKREFAYKYYNIPKENVYYVEHNKDKTQRLIEISKKYPELDNHHIIMVDDTIKVLNDVFENTSFSTVHISSFLDL